MPTYRHSSGKRFLFIHIPRTGGRFIETNLELNNWELEPIDYRGISHGNWALIDDCEVAHFHKPLHEKYCDIKNIPHICVVRNPIDRFISASIYLTEAYGSNIQEAAEDQSQLNDMIKEFPMPESFNWFRQQNDFLSEKTNIWRYEDGLASKFSKWMSSLIGIDIKMNVKLKFL